MSRHRPSSRRRRQARLKQAARDRLAIACLEAGNQALALPDSNTPSTTGPASQAPAAAPSQPQQDADTATTTHQAVPRPRRRRCQHRRQRDRDYYHRVETLDYRNLAFHRRTRNLLDEKIIEAKLEIRRWEKEAMERYHRNELITDSAIEQLRREGGAVLRRMKHIEEEFEKTKGRMDRFEDRVNEKLQGYDKEMYGV